LTYNPGVADCDLIGEIMDVETIATGDVCVVDESGENYLFAADRFVAIEVPAAVRTSILRA
jgi:hypothetical protein